MKKTFKNWLLPVVVAASAVVGWSFFGPYPTNYITLTAVPETDGGVRFEVANLPDFDLSKTDNRYKIFLNTGDGYAFSETVNLVPPNTSVTLTHKHYYPSTTQSYKTYAEATALDYDDKNPPPFSLRANSPGFVPTVPSSLTNYSVSMSAWARIDATRNAVPGDSITYMVTYQNPAENGCSQPVHGDISLQYDSDKLEYLSTDNYFGESGFTQSTLSSTSKEVKWTYLNLEQGKQRNIFLKFLVKSNAQVNSLLNPTPTLVFTHGADNQVPGTATPNPCANNTMSEVHQGSAQVAYSHDPNEKISDLKSICLDEQFITYTVRFQNEGAAAADTVVIYDELDLVFGSAIPVLVGSSHPQHLAQFHYDNGTRRRLTIRFGGANKPDLNLRGLTEPGFGTKFPVSATMGYVTFKVQLPTFDVPLHCSATVNRAKIVFDCNPPMWTTTDIAPYLCDSCKTCTILLDSTITIASEFSPGKGNISNPLNAIVNLALKNQLLAQFDQFRWYPSVGVQTPLSLLTQFQSVQTDEYTLIASKSGPTCQRAIIHFPINFPNCQLEILTDPAGLVPSACIGQSTGTIRAWIGGTDVGTAPYTWQNCMVTQSASTVMTSPILTNLPPGKYYLGVTDATGCTAEKWVTVQATPNPLQVDDDPNDCSANLLVSGGTPDASGNYSYAWKYNGSQQTFSGQNLNLASKNGISVTVTDAAGCTVVFAPKPSNCTGTLGWQEIALILFSALAALLGLRFLFSRKK